MKKKRLLALVAVTVLFSLVYLMGIESIQSNASTPPRGKNSKVLREDTSRRREFEKHFELDDGMYMVVSYSEPVHKKVNEKWEEVDNTLIATTDKNGKVRYRARNPINEISFSKTLEDDLVSMECDGNSISWGLKVIRPEKASKGQSISGAKQKREQLRQVGAVISKPDLSALAEEGIQTLADKSTSTIRYNDVLENGVDLEYVVLPSQVKENIILNTHQDITAYIVNVQTDNLSARLLEDKQVEFSNGGKVVFTMWSPYMFDSAGKLSEDIAVELKDEGSGKFTITMTPDAQWLNDSERVYPVTIDPTVTTSRARSNIIDNYVSEGKGVQNYNLDRLYIGRRSGTRARAYIRYAEMPLLPMNAQIYQTTHRVNITSGTSTANTANAYLVGANWSSSTIKWSNMPSANTLLASNIGHNNRTYYSFYANTAIRKWYNCLQDSVVKNPNGTTNNYGIMMRYNNESINDYNAFYSADYSVESQRPRMTIVYNIMPTPTPPPSGANYLRPLKGTQSLANGAKFGASRDSGARAHAGIDFYTGLGDAGKGVPIYAVTDGVARAYYFFWEGTYALEVVNSDGTILRYGEIITTLNGVNQRPSKGISIPLNIPVKRGQKLGETIPNTKPDNGGNMLHLEYYKNTVTGKLTDSSNTKVFDYVPVKPYERRRDLLDPTFIFNLPKW